MRIDEYPTVSYPRPMPDHIYSREQIPDARLAHHLENWCTWMHTGATEYLKAPGKSCGFVAGGYSTDFEEMCMVADRQAAEIMDALITSLQPIQRAAVNHRYLRAVYRFPKSNYDEILHGAFDRLRAGMAERGLV